MRWDPGGASIRAAWLRGGPGGALRAGAGSLHERERAGELGFVALPADDGARDAVQEVADSFAQWFEDLVVVGIGGSSLGGRALADALLGTHWNEISAEDREHYPRLHFLENADPESVASLLRRIDPRRTLFNIVSKSGSTAETMALFLVLEEVVENAVGEEKSRGHFLFTTDPEEGVLRRLARERGIPALAIPAGGGGALLRPLSGGPPPRGGGGRRAGSLPRRGRRDAPSMPRNHPDREPCRRPGDPPPRP
jgi:glucose-6-phosphate isomerase